MLPVQIHLVLNHVPVVGLVFGLVSVTLALKRSSTGLFATSLWIFIAMGLIAIPVAISGLVSADSLRGTEWLDPRAVSRHQTAAMLTLGILLVLATVSGIVLAASVRRGHEVPAGRKAAVIVIAVAALVVGLWTAKLGGAVRHTELDEQPKPRPTAARTTAPGENEAVGR